jgi:bisphosphoglycerate-dependent phosphoglycerate mutase
VAIQRADVREQALVYSVPAFETLRFTYINYSRYGALEGHSKPGLANMYGEEIVLRWREGVHERPPPMTPGAAMFMRFPTCFFHHCRSSRW